MILVTGFAPFAGFAVNPAAEVAAALAGRDVAAEVLPVDYRRALPRVAELLCGSAPAPDAVVLLGVAPERAAFVIERAARNRVDPARPDEAGHVPGAGVVVAGAPDLLPSTASEAQARALAELLCAARFPAELSTDAGSFLCNAVYFRALHALRTRPGRAPPCMFVHLPPCPGMGRAPAVDVAEQIHAMRLLVDALRRQATAGAAPIAASRGARA